MNAHRTALDPDHSSILATLAESGEPGLTAEIPDLATWLEAVLVQLGYQAVADTGGLGEVAVERLRARGVQVEDLGSGEAGSLTRTLLESTSEAGIAGVREELKRRFEQRRFLVACPNLLDRLGFRDVAEVLANLVALGCRHLVVVVRCVPGKGMNAGRPMVLPQESWLALLRHAGYELVSGVRMPGPAAPVEDDSQWAAVRWRQMDPYRDRGAAEPRVLLLSLRESPLRDREALRSACRRVMGPRWREWPRLERTVDADWTFLVGHVQDFSAYIPFWASLPKDRVRVIFRRSGDRAIPPRLGAGLLSWMKTRGIECASIARTDDWDWSRRGGRPGVFLAHSESNVVLSHMLNAAFSACARYHGLPTALLQHGIWVEEFGGPVAFSSGRLLSWSPEHARFFRGQGSALVSGFPAPRGYLAGTEVIVTGSPKFDAYAWEGSFERTALFGSWATKYERIVVCTTNLNWPKHAVSGSGIRGGIMDLAERFPRWLFVVKPHPMELVMPHDYAASSGNLLLLDEFACWWAGLTTTDLIRAADLVISTVSTTILEAALAQKPCVVLETGNRFLYDFVKTTPPETVAQVLAESPGHSDYDGRFAENYYDLQALGCGLANVVRVMEHAASHPTQLSEAELRSICVERAMGGQLTWLAEEYNRLLGEAG